MSSIDQRIVEMQFNNSAFEKGVKETLKTLESLKKELNLEESAKGIEKLQKAGDSFSLARMADSISNVEKRFSTLGIAGMTAIANITNSVVDAGKKFTKSLSVDNIGNGWIKYNQKVSSVQTIMNATGKSIDEVNEYLEKLMWFSDETSYSFTDMTSALGQLTTAGGDIDKLIPMIEGIATATAFAGKGTGEFTRAIYNLNQSYSSGYLKYMDWRSLELAGVASKELKEVLINTAVAEGKLKKDAKGIAKTTKGTAVTVASFSETLAENWANTEVMEKGFGAFAEVMDEAYKLVQAGEFDTASEAIASLSGKFDEFKERAAKSAQEAKTFNEAITATKDAVSSGWMKSFELIFGNYEEAKILWTDLANGLWEVFASGAAARNEVLEKWKDAGGRAKLIEGLTDAFTGLWNIINAFKSGYRSIVPESIFNANNLMKLSEKVQQFGKNFKETFYTRDILTDYTEDVSEAGKATEKFSKQLSKGDKGDEVKKLQQALIDAGFEVGPAGADGIFGSKTLEGLQQFQEKFGLTVDGVYKELDHEKLFAPTKKWTETWRAWYSDSLEKVKSIGAEVAKVIHGEFKNSKKSNNPSIFKTLSSVVKVLLKENVFESINKIKTILIGVVSAFSIGIKTLKLFANVALLVAKALAPIVRLAVDIAVAIANLFTWLNKTLSVSDTFGKAFEFIEKILKPIGDEIKNFVDSFEKFFGFSKNKNILSKLFGKKSKDEVSEFGKVWDKVKSNVEKLDVWNKLKASFTKLKSSFKNIGVSVKAMWNNVKKYVGDKFIEIFEKTGDALPGVIEKIATTFTKLVDLTTKVFDSIKEFLFGKTIEHGGLEGNNSDIGLFRKIRNFFSQFSDEALENEENLNTAQQIWLRVKNAYESLKDFISTLLFGKTIEHGGLEGNTELSIFERIKNFFSQFTDEALQNEETLNLAQQIWIRIKNAYKTIKDFISTLLFGKTIEHGGLEGNTKLSIFERIKNFFSKFTDDAAKDEEKLSLAQRIWNRIKIIYDSIKNFISGIFKKKPAKKDAAKDTDLQNSAISIGESIGNFFNKALEIYNKYKPLILGGGILAGLLIISISIASFINKFIENLAYARGKNKNEGKTLGEKMLDIAYAIGIIAGIIVLIGSLDPSVLKQGGIVVGSIAVAILAIMFISGLINKFLSEKGPGKTNAASAVKSIADAILEIALVCWLLGKVNPDSFWAGYKIMLVIAGTVLAIEAISQIISMIPGKGGDPAKSIKNIADAILEIAVVCWLLGKVNATSFWKGYGMLWAIAGVVAALVAISGLAAGLSKGNKATGAGGFIGMAVAILAIAYEIQKLGKLPANELWKGVGAIAVIAAAIAGIALAAKGMDKTSILGIFVIGIVIAGVALALSYAISLIKDVDTGKIIAFIGGVVGVIAAIGGMSLAASAIQKANPGVSMIGGALSLAASIGIIILSAGIILGGLKKINDWVGHNSDYENVFQEGGKYLKDIANAYKTLGEDWGVVLTALGGTAALGLLGKKDPDILWRMPVGALSFGISIGAIIITAGLILTALQKLNNWAGSNSDYENVFQEGGEHLQTIANAFDFLSRDPLENVKSIFYTFGTALASYALGSNLAMAGKIILGALAFDAIIGVIIHGLGWILVGLAKLNDWMAENSDYESVFEEGAKHVESIMGALETFFRKLGGSIGEFIGGLGGGVVSGYKKQQTDAETYKLEQFWEAIFGEGGLAETVEGFGETTMTADVGAALGTIMAIAKFLKSLEELSLGDDAFDFLPRLFGKEDSITGFRKYLLGENGKPGLVDIIKEMDKELTGVNVSNASSAVEPLWKTADAIAKLEEVSKADPDLTNVTSLLSTFQGLTSGEGEGGITNDSFFQNISADVVGQKIVDFATNLSTYIETAKGIIDGYTTQFNTAGSGMMEAMTGGMSGDVDTGSIESACSAMLNAASSYQDNFENVGKFFAMGVGNGISEKTPWVESIASSMMKRAIAAAKAAAQIASPSKATYRLGKFFDLGFANAVQDYGRVAEKSSIGMVEGVMKSARGSLSDLSSIINNNMEDADPVVRPVVDLTNVSEGAKAINGLIGDRTATIGATVSTKNANAASSSIAKMKNNQNGNTIYNNNDTYGTGNPVNLTGNNFYIRSENDIRQLASELAALTWQQRRALGATR